MNSFLLTVGDDEYRLKASTQSKVDAEKRLGMSLLRAQTRLDEAEVFSIILWAALQPLNHGMAMKDTYELIDQMEDYGCSYIDPVSGENVSCDSIGVAEKVELSTAILAVSGFFTKEELKNLREKKDEVKPRKPRKKSIPPQQN